MKVLQVLPSLDAGGVERGTLEIGKALAEAGCESWVCSAGGRLVEQLLAEGSRHFQLDLGRKAPATLLKIPRLQRFLRENGFDIVHVRSRLPAWMVRFALRGLAADSNIKGCPKLVSTVHGLYSVTPYSEVMTRGDRVIAVSNTVKEYLRESYPRLLQERVTVIHRGIDSSVFSLSHRVPAPWIDNFYAQHPALKQRPLVLLPGRIARLKGHGDFIDVVERVKQHVPNVAGVIVGSVSPAKKAYKAELETLCRQRQLGETIFFIDHQADIRNLYGIAAAVVSLSRQPESFGRTVLEALAMGRPVVGYDHGGVAEILARLYPYGAVAWGDIEAAAARLVAVLKGCHPAPMENRAFLLETMQAQTLDLYREVLE